MRTLACCLSCLLIAAFGTCLRAQPYGPNVSVTAGQINSFPGQPVAGTLSWWGRRSPVFSQTDPRWAQRAMGRSGETMAELGCFVAAAAMVRNLLGFSTTIRQMLALAGRDPTFQARGYVSSTEILHRLFPGHAVRFAPDDGFEAVEMDGASLVILRIDQTPAAKTREWHWVLLLSQVGADYMVMDPFDGGVRPLRDAPACAADYPKGDLCAPVDGGYVITVAPDTPPLS